MSLHQTRSYSLTISSDLDDDFLSAHCPPGATLIHSGNCTRIDNLQTDQAGILGLLRALHNLGLTILEVNTSAERISP